MRVLISLISSSCLLFVIACNNAAEPIGIQRASNTPAPSNARPAASVDEHGHEDNAPRITLVDAKKAYDSGEAVFVDTHSPDQYAIQHIPGAVNIPANDIAGKADKLPKGKKIIAYCS
jgi:hypothetical protein